MGGRDAIRASRSIDGGRTFPPAITLHDPALEGTRGWQSVAAEADGTAHIVWLDGRNANGPTTEPRRSPRQDVFHAAWGTDASVTETSLAADVCFCCKTATAIDEGGTVYAAWRHIYPGNIRDMALSRSDGPSFQPPVRVSEDAWELEGCPDDGPALVVDEARRLHAVWPTLVPGVRPEIGIFYAGAPEGRRFGPRRRVATLGGSDPSHPRIALAGADRVAIVWDEITDGIRRVVMSLATRTESDEIRLGSPQVLSDAENGSYPVVGSIDGGVVVAWTSGPPDASVIGLRRVIGGMESN